MVQRTGGDAAPFPQLRTPRGLLWGAEAALRAGAGRRSGSGRELREPELLRCVLSFPTRGVPHGSGIPHSSSAPPTQRALSLTVSTSLGDFYFFLSISFRFCLYINVPNGPLVAAGR